MSNVAIIILNYNTWEDTLKEVEQVKLLFKLSPSDIIVIDNCSPNDSAKMLAAESKDNFTFIHSSANNGYAAGNNIGLRYSYSRGYEYAFILNNDILFDDHELIAKLLAVFSADPSIASVNPDIYAPDGSMFNRDAKYPTLYDFTLGMFSYIKKGRRLQDLGGYGLVYRPQGCCMILDLKKCEEINYMDEHTFLYSEEIILAERLAQKGYKCACCPDARIIHNHSKTVKSALQKKTIHKIQEDSFLYYLKEYRHFNRFERLLCLYFNKLKTFLLELR